MANIVLCYSDLNRYWTVGTYVCKILERYNEIKRVYMHHDIEVIDHWITKEDWKPDLILAIDDGTNFFRPWHNQHINCPTVYWCSDTHYDQSWYEKRAEISCRYDYVFAAHKNGVEKLKKDTRKKDIYHLPHAVDPEIFRFEQHYKKQYDIGFVGFENEARKNTFNYLKEKKYNLKVANNVWASSASKIYNQSKLVINIPLDKDWLNMRTFEAMATKTPLILNYNPDFDYGFSDFFQTVKHCLTYKTFSELSEKIEILLKDKKVYDEIAKNAYNEVISKHTYWHRMRTLIDTLNLKNKIKI